MSSLSEHAARHERAVAEMDEKRSDQELIADARDWVAYCREAKYGSPSSADMIDDLADALEAAREQALADARDAASRQTVLASLVAGRPTDFEKGVLSCLAAIDNLKGTKQ